MTANYKQQAAEQAAACVCSGMVVGLGTGSTAIFATRRIADLLRRGVLVMLKTAYDEAMPKTLSPALLLHEAELQRMFADGEVRRVEFYGRVMDWHTRFTEHRRGLYHLTAYRWPAVKALALRRRAAAQARAPATAEPVASDAEGH